MKIYNPKRDFAILEAKAYYTAGGSYKGAKEIYPRISRQMLKGLEDFRKCKDEDDIPVILLRFTTENPEQERLKTRLKDQRGIVKHERNFIEDELVPKTMKRVMQHRDVQKIWQSAHGLSASTYQKLDAATLINAIQQICEVAWEEKPSFSFILDEIATIAKINTQEAIKREEESLERKKQIVARIASSLTKFMKEHSDTLNFLHDTMALLEAVKISLENVNEEGLVERKINTLLQKAYERGARRKGKSIKEFLQDPETNSILLDIVSDLRQKINLATAEINQKIERGKMAILGMPTASIELLNNLD